MDLTIYDERKNRITTARIIISENSVYYVQEKPQYWHMV